MKDKLSVVQNFIIGTTLAVGRAPEWAKINHIQSEQFGLPASARVLGDCKWVVNYKTEAYLDTIKSLYESHIPDLSFHNVLDGPDFHFALHTLELLEEIDTPYVFFLTEDRMFHYTTKEEFSAMIDEISQLGVDWMPIGKLHKYIPQYRGYAKHSTVYTCKGFEAPHSGMVLDSIFKKEFLIDALQRVVNIPPDVNGKCNGYPWNVPHTLEKVPYWVKSEAPNCIIACPKRELIISDQDPAWRKWWLANNDRNAHDCIEPWRLS